ncbi:hypothetical protein PO909_031288 [Leuciscus waleckii]
MMMSLAAIAFITSVMIMGTSKMEKNRPVECCTSVSTNEITLPITGFKLQKSKPPCVKAVIFYTSEGPRCSHWSETWVWEKLQDLRKLKGYQKEWRFLNTIKSICSLSFFRWDVKLNISKTLSTASL